MIHAMQNANQRLLGCRPAVASHSISNGLCVLGETAACGLGVGGVAAARWAFARCSLAQLVRCLVDGAADLLANVLQCVSIEHQGEANTASNSYVNACEDALDTLPGIGARLSRLASARSVAVAGELV